jgi:hypothetical protein
VLAAIDTNLNIHKALAAAVPASMRFCCSLMNLIIPCVATVAVQAALSTNYCPPPSRIFHGRQLILEKMHKFFEEDFDNQKIYLLHGLGGSGKTQIALKFIQESTSR